MEIKTFDISYLNETKETLKSAFYHENSNEIYNEWEFAERVIKSDGYMPELCLIAVEGGNVVG